VTDKRHSVAPTLLDYDLALALCSGNLAEPVTWGPIGGGMNSRWVLKAVPMESRLQFQAGINAVNAGVPEHYIVGRARDLIEGLGDASFTPG